MGQGDAIDELQVPTHGKASCQATHADPRARNPLLDKGRGGLALERRVGGEHHLSYLAPSQTVLQQTNAQGIGTHAVERREMASEDDIPPAKPRSVEHGNRRGFLHDTDQSVIPPRVLAGVAGIGFGKVATGRAGTDSVGYTGQCRRERAGSLARLLQQVVGESLCRLPPDSR